MSDERACLKLALAWLKRGPVAIQEHEARIRAEAAADRTSELIAKLRKLGQLHAAALMLREYPDVPDNRKPEVIPMKKRITLKERVAAMFDRACPKEDTTAGDGATIAAAEMRFDDRAEKARSEAGEED